MSAFWPGFWTLAGVSDATDNLFIELGFGDATTINTTNQRIYTGGNCDSTATQNGGVISVDLTPPAGTWTFYLRMMESAGNIGTYVIQNDGVGTTRFTLEERAGSKYN